MTVSRILRMAIFIFSRILPPFMLLTIFACTTPFPPDPFRNQMLTDYQEKTKLMRAARIERNTLRLQNEKKSGNKRVKQLSSSNEQTQVVEITLYHMSNQEAGRLLSELLGNEDYGDDDYDDPSSLDIGVHNGSSKLYVKGSPEQVEHAIAIIENADRERQKVLLEALVVEYDAIEMERLGADINIGALTTAFGSATAPAIDFSRSTDSLDPGRYSILIDILFTKNKARLIARPFITTLSGENAEIEITMDRYVLVETSEQGATVRAPQAVEAGISLRILPTVYGDGLIKMKVHIEDSKFLPSPQNVALNVDKNQASSTLEVGDGETMIIGGLRLNQAAMTTAGLPGTSDIPILNFLTTDRSAEYDSKEVAIYITPHLVSDTLKTPYSDDDVMSLSE